MVSYFLTQCALFNGNVFVNNLLLDLHCTCWCGELPVHDLRSGVDDCSCSKDLHLLVQNIPAFFQFWLVFFSFFLVFWDLRKKFWIHVCGWVHTNDTIAFFDVHFIVYVVSEQVMFQCYRHPYFECLVIQLFLKYRSNKCLVWI